MAELMCRTYWGSHGCELLRHHDGDHKCDCCDCEDHARDYLHCIVDGFEYQCVGSAPYYGPDTAFFGEDAPETIVGELVREDLQLEGVRDGAR